MLTLDQPHTMTKPKLVLDCEVLLAFGETSLWRLPDHEGFYSTKYGNPPRVEFAYHHEKNPALKSTLGVVDLNTRKGLAGFIKQDQQRGVLYDGVRNIFFTVEHVDEEEVFVKFFKDKK
jgi:hypothetical protein